MLKYYINNIKNDLCEIFHKEDLDMNKKATVERLFDEFRRDPEQNLEKLMLHHIY